MAKISGKSVEKPMIKIHGLAGKFELPNKRIKVHYFSTIASNKNLNSNYYGLLEELKPVRERVKTNELKNLDSLLQRDLNDRRVAEELIPYLLGKTPEVAFFPAILAVLMPSGFLAQTRQAYPIPNKIVQEDGSAEIKYGENWTLELFSIDEIESKLGLLSIDPKSTDIIVLDGQHRANAFRAITGAFKMAENQIYSTFYPDISGNELTSEDYEADLPVTLIWFETTDGKVDPTLISRKLFVDVNNNARRVSETRSILLNDFEIPSLLTKFLYSEMAEKTGYSRETFSLFHMAFDYDSGSPKADSNPFPITNPSIVYYINSWLALGSENYDYLDKYKVSREAFRDSSSKLIKVLSASGKNLSPEMISIADTLNEGKEVVIRDSKYRQLFHDAFKETLAPVFQSLFEGFPLYFVHFKACKKIEELFSSFSSAQMSVWEKVFCGGEGLYYTFLEQKITSGGRGNDISSQYLRAISEIEKEFYTIRKGFFEIKEDKVIRSAYDSARTKAFQVGLFKALDVYSTQKGLPMYECCNEFVSLLNDSISLDNWVYILTSYRGESLSQGVDPKVWPFYQKLILRIIQNKSDFEFYNSENFNFSPDGRIFLRKIENSLNSWKDQNRDLVEAGVKSSSIKKQISQWANQAHNELSELLQKCGLNPIDDVDYEIVANSFVRDKLNDLT